MSARTSGQPGAAAAAATGKYPGDPGDPGDPHKPQDPQNARTPHRPRDAEATKQALVDAAFARFARDGLAGTGVRDVARDAGVDQALVYRYFGSKQALYDEVLLHYARHLDALFQVPENFAEHVTEYLFEAPASVRVEPLIGLLSAGTGQVTDSPIHRVLGGFLERLAERSSVELEEARLRAALIGALTVGIPVLRDVIGDRPLEDAEPSQVAPLYAQAVEALLHPRHGDNQPLSDSPTGHE